MRKLLCIIAASCLSTPVLAQDPGLAAAFGAREGVRSGSLSPDGSKIALIASGAGQSTSLFVVDAKDGSSKPIFATVSGKPRLRQCRWVGNTRLVCTIGGLVNFGDDIYGVSSVIALDSTGANQKVLSSRRGANATSYDLRGGAVIDYLPDDDGLVLMMRSYVPEAKVGSLIEKTGEGMGVDRIDTRTGSASRVESPQRDADEYITDQYGVVRINIHSPSGMPSDVSFA